MRWIQRLLPFTVVFVAGLVLGASAGAYFVFHVWQKGKAEQHARVSTLMILRGYLVQYAQQHGQYPQQMSEAFYDQPVPPSLDEIAYVAAGQPFPLAAHAILFYEKRAKHYGFEYGYFTFDELDWWFFSGKSPRQTADPQ